jgi:Protein of unknown function (DUF3987)
MNSKNLNSYSMRELTEEEKLPKRANRRQTEGNEELFHDVMKSLDTIEFDGEEWTPPVTFDEHEVIPFPAEVFSTTIHDMVKAVANDTQTPVDLAAMVCIGVLSTALSKKFAIEPKPGWKEPLNTYTVVLLPPGAGKSPTFKAIADPIYSYANELLEDLESKITQRNSSRKTLEKRLDKLQTDYAKRNDPEVLKEINIVNDDLLKNPEIKKPRLTLDNATTEIVVKALQENNEKISIMSTEGDLFMKFLNPAELEKSAIYLKGHSGDLTQVDRMGREGEYVKEPLLTICITAQPTVFNKIPAHIHERGIPARFLFSIPNDTLGYRDVFSASVPPEVKRKYNELIRKLLVFNPGETITLKIKGEAIEKLKSFMSTIEVELRENGLFEGHLRFWGSKLVGQILRIAGLLHVIHLAESSNLEGISAEVSLEIIEKAISLKDYFISHAQKVFGIMRQNDTFNDATYLLEKILKEKKQMVEKQTIHQKSKKRILGKERYTRAYDLLEYHSYIKQIKGGKYGNKGMILVNPALFKNS